MTYETSHRRLTDQEAAAARMGRLGLHGCMETLLGPILPGGCVTIIGYFGLGGILALLQVFGFAKPPFPELAKGAFIILPLIAGLTCGWIYQRQVRRTQRALRTDLRNGDVEVTTFKAARVVRQESDNDAVSLYYYDLGDRRNLFLLGQWGLVPEFCEDEEVPADPRKQLPSSMFIVHRLPLSGFVLKVEVLGDPLVPVGVTPLKLVLPASWRKMGPDDNVYREYSLFEGDFEDLVKLSRPVPPAKPDEK